MRDWPSSRLYSEWTCRWVKSATENHHPSRYRVSTVFMLGLVRREDDGARAGVCIYAVALSASLASTSVQTKRDTVRQLAPCYPAQLTVAHARLSRQPASRMGQAGCTPPLSPLGSGMPSTFGAAKRVVRVSKYGQFSRGSSRQQQGDRHRATLRCRQSAGRCQREVAACHPWSGHVDLRCQEQQPQGEET